MPRRFPEAPDSLPAAGLLRRFLAMVYDGLICIALLMVVTEIYNTIYQLSVGADRYKVLFESGATTHDPLLTSVLFISLYLFFAYFWTRTGQTLGMQVWLIRTQNPDGSSISWLQALLRFMMGFVSWGAVGLGYLWQLVDRKHQTWTDRFSESIVVRLPRPYGNKDKTETKGETTTE
ncbi:RDD family protein [Mangrovitalea sediminis]|uniref:RDD family protein n=1 Tax=Mangrovitalea sediminis TaxID=1982043 RepID=UPI000BE5941D|nr:RDD family protein [Mangrovitalea sediminis]